MLGTSEILLILLVLPLTLGALAFWLWMLVDAVRNPSLNDTERIVWVVIICLLQALGAFVYLLFGRRGSGKTANP